MAAVTANEGAASLIAFVQARLPVGTVPTVPEIRLHQAAPHSGLRAWAEQAGWLAPPYWAHLWSGGLVLARYLLDEPRQVAGQAVLDLGTGSGLVAIAAARAGAAQVTAADSDPHALTVVRLNAALNGVAIDLYAGDLTGGPAPASGVVLCGDVFYDEAVAARVTRFLERCIGAGCTVLVGDPGRAHLPLARLRPLRSRLTPDFGTGGPTTSTVYRFGPT